MSRRVPFRSHIRKPPSLGIDQREVDLEDNGLNALTSDSQLLAVGQLLC